MKVLSTNTKLEKCQPYGWLAYGLQLAPGNHSGYEVCAWRTGCFEVCLYSAGFGKFDNVKDARIDRTKRVFEDFRNFSLDLLSDIEKLVVKAEKMNLLLCVRPNTLSDLAWEALLPEMFEAFPNVQMYDYTKSIKRWKQFLEGKMPSNYHLTYSINEKSKPEQVSDLVRMGGTASIVSTVAAESIALSMKQRGYHNFEHFHDGDVHDLTFVHPKRTLLVLSPKGDALDSSSSFIHHQ
jgi:hypothetical protein